jgi:pilus assembly protein CpaE
MTNLMNFTRRMKILIASSDQSASAFMQDALSALSQFDSEVRPPEVLVDPKRAISPEDFDLLVLDAGDGALLETGMVQELRRKFASMPLIVVSEPLSDQRLRLLLKLNGSDWLKKPLERKSFIESVSGHVQLGQSGGNQVHAVISAVGGAGGTSVAITLADALSRAKKKKKDAALSVALFDLDFSTGACGNYLNLLNDYDLQPVVASPTRVDLEFIDIVKRKHPRGFSLLSFRQPAVLLSPSGRELVLRMLDVVAFQNNHTVLDIPYYETSWRTALFSAVNSVHLVTELTIPGLKQAKDIYQNIKNLRGNDFPVEVIANKYRKRLFSLGLGKRETGKVFKQKRTRIIEDEWATISEAINRGVLPVEVNPRSKFVRQIEALAEAVR